MKQVLLIAMISSSLLACNSGADKAAQAEAAKQRTIDSLNTALVKQRAIDSVKLSQERIEKKNAQVARNRANESAQASGSGNLETTSSQPAKKKGLSHTAKGAIVGAGAGAITGAIINHDDRVKGAAIGTVLGAGIGAGTGAIVDKSVKKKRRKASSANQ
ncbi:MAG TPA: hypothetical protein VL307_19085 [Chitinophagaceae bacterium]|nr:hypothetical protein [Chitinophagaceae bacterium]